MTPLTSTRRQFLAVAGLLAARATAHPNLAEPMTTTDRLVDGNSTFACDLYGRLRAARGNLFLSPFSISTALAMTSVGARKATLAQMNAVLHLPAEPHPAFAELLTRVAPAGAARKFELTTANAVWGQAGIPWSDEFQAVARKCYGTGVLETDFRRSEAARARINGWVEKQTHEKIKDLVPAGVLDADTRMVLANAIYFKGAWLAPFTVRATSPQPFHLDDGSTAPVPMMRQTASFGCADAALRGEDRLQVLQLPYVGKEASMVVLLPEAGKLAALEEQLSPENLTRWTKLARPQQVQTMLPKFRVEAAVSLADHLIALGMRAPFESADFSGLTTAERLAISHVLHKAFVDVTEEGTEAAAATAVVMTRSSAPARPTVFKADRPFLFVIRHDPTGSILFLGRYSQPKA